MIQTTSILNNSITISHNHNPRTIYICNSNNPLSLVYKSKTRQTTHITYSSSKFQSHYPTIVIPTPHSLTHQQHTFSNRIIRFPLLSSHLSQLTSLYTKVNHPIKFQKENHHVTFNLHIPSSILLQHNDFPIQASTHCKSFVHCVSDKSTPLHFCLFTIHYSTRQYLTVAISATISQSTSITH